MLIKPITYEDLDGNMVTGTFEFNLDKSEIAELELSREGGLSEYAKRIAQTNDHRTLVRLFKEVILLTYGKREGNRFVKCQDYTDEFVQSGAYSEMFMELATNAGAAVEFFREVVPSSMKNLVEEPSDDAFTDEQLLSMSDSEFASVAGNNPKTMSKRHLQIAFQRKSAA